MLALRQTNMDRITGSLVPRCVMSVWPPCYLRPDWAFVSLSPPGPCTGGLYTRGRARWWPRSIGGFSQVWNNLNANVQTTLTSDVTLFPDVDQVVVSVSRVAISMFLDGAWRCELPALAACGHFHALLTLSFLCSGRQVTSDREYSLITHSTQTRSQSPRAAQWAGQQ